MPAERRGPAVRIPPGAETGTQLESVTSCVLASEFGREGERHAHGEERDAAPGRGPRAARVDNGPTDRCGKTLAGTRSGIRQQVIDIVGQSCEKQHRFAASNGTKARRRR